MTPSPDTTLMTRLLAGDEAAWDACILEWGPMLHAIARRTLLAHGGGAGGHDADDAVAAVWENLIENDGRALRQIMARNNLLPALCVMVRRRAVDLLRRRRGMVALLPDVEPLAPEASGADEPEIDDETLAAALGHLGGRERTLVRLYYQHDKTYREIALLTGIPENSIGPTLSRALERLRGLIGAAGAGHGRRGANSASAC